MTHEFSSLIVPTDAHKIEVLMPEVKLAQTDMGVVELTPEQLQAREAFLKQDAEHKEADQVAGLFGVWTGAMLLHDMTLEHLEQPTEEQLVERKRKEDNEAE